MDLFYSYLNHHNYNFIYWFVALNKNAKVDAIACLLTDSLEYVS